MRARLLVLPLCCSLTAPAASQVVTGEIVSVPDNVPVADAALRLAPEDGDTAAAVSDTAGRFVLRPGRRGAYVLEAEAQGLRSARSPAEFRLGEGDSLHVLVRLSADSVLARPVQVLAAVRMTAALREFYARAAQNRFGWFVTRAEIEEQHPFQTVDLLRRAPGIRILPTRGTLGYGVRGRGGCIPNVYVDGTRVVGGAAAIDFWIAPQDLEGIEVYTESTAPPQYGGRNSACTVILLWTRIQ